MSKETAIDKVTSKSGERIGKTIGKPTSRNILRIVSGSLEEKQAERFCRHYPPIEEPWVGFSKV